MAKKTRLKLQKLSDYDRAYAHALIRILDKTLEELENESYDNDEDGIFGTQVDATIQSVKHEINKLAQLFGILD